MVSKLFLVTLLAFPMVNLPKAQAASCNPSIVSNRELGSTISPEMLGNLYARAMLNIAKVAVLENYGTFEDAARDIVSKAEGRGLESLKSRAKNFNYWQKNNRISNADFSLVASLMGLDQAELAALNLAYLANKGDPSISFSEAIFKIISKGDNLTVVTSGQLDQLLGDFPSACLQKIPKNQLVNLINKLNMAVSENLNDVSIDGEYVRFAQTSLMHMPSLKVVKTKYDPADVDSLHVGFRLLSEVGGSFNSYRDSNAVIHSVSNLETIKHFHKFYGLSDFAVLNKKEKTLTFFDESARVQKRITIDIASTDDRMNAGGAGIYYGLIDKGNTYYAKALSDRGMREVFKSRQGQVIRINGPLYILPQDTGAHKFRIKNKRLAFSGYQFYRKSRNLNYSIESNTKFKLEIRHSYKSKFVADYINTLEKEKSRLMQILKVDNDDYNILAGFAIGVLAPESDFGKNWKYVLKEFLPGAVSLAKGNGLDTSKNSRGPTQLKVIPEEIMEAYGISKTNLTDPENAAVATIAISADFLKQLRNLGVNHKAINEENIQTYLYYLYQGKRVQIKEALATPDDNLAIRKIVAVVKGLEFLEY
ncbi:hypothetical protein C0V70_03325 [Bacteriovorax stolpii]|uniref:Uncharacterized protein n=1 Tax=Bacteriovorax stolpii TaxID=960 RepID=A0A2K9NQX6_BACTC|nr:hypothetical protein [Bacteriovorax stolpii]AUN97154.1 hypothetical protein C0V70_03325 [Bacteriovorax stolpii]TDP53440.1 hypothetical protein C8D79_2084 [Bacteriovorax stolpii]